MHFSKCSRYENDIQHFCFLVSIMGTSCLHLLRNFIFSYKKKRNLKFFNKMIMHHSILETLTEVLWTEILKPPWYPDLTPPDFSGVTENANYWVVRHVGSFKTLELGLWQLLKPCYQNCLNRFYVYRSLLASRYILHCNGYTCGYLLIQILNMCLEFCLCSYLIILFNIVKKM